MNNMAAAIMKHGDAHKDNDHDNNSSGTSKEQKWSRDKESTEGDNGAELDVGTSCEPIDVEDVDSESSSPYKMASGSEAESNVVTSEPRVQLVPLATGENSRGEEVKKRSISRSSDYEKLVPNGFVSRGDALQRGQLDKNNTTRTTRSSNNNNDNNSNNNADDSSSSSSSDDDDVVATNTAAKENSPNVRRKRNFGWNWMNGSNEAQLRGSRPYDVDDDDGGDGPLPKEDEDCEDEQDVERDGDYEEHYQRYVNVDANFRRKGNTYYVNVAGSDDPIGRDGDMDRPPEARESPADGDKFVLFEDESYDDDNDDIVRVGEDNDNVTRHEKAGDGDVIEASPEIEKGIPCPTGSGNGKDDDDDGMRRAVGDSLVGQQRAGDGPEKAATDAGGGFEESVDSDDVMRLRRNDVEEFQFSDVAGDFQTYDQSEAGAAIDVADKNDKGYNDDDDDDDDNYDDGDDDGDDDYDYEYDDGGADNDDSPNVVEIRDEADKPDVWKRVPECDEEIPNSTNIIITVLHSPHHCFYDDDDDDDYGVDDNDDDNDDENEADSRNLRGADDDIDDDGGGDGNDNGDVDKPGEDKHTTGGHCGDDDNDVAGDNAGDDNYGGDTRRDNCADDKRSDGVSGYNFAGNEKYGEVNVAGDGNHGDSHNDGGGHDDDDDNDDDGHDDDNDDDDNRQCATREDEDEVKLGRQAELIFHQSIHDYDDSRVGDGNDDDGDDDLNKHSDQEKHSHDDDAEKHGHDSDLEKKGVDDDRRRPVDGEDDDLAKPGDGNDLGKSGADTDDPRKVGDDSEIRRKIESIKKVPPVPAEKPKLKIRGALNARMASEDLEFKRTSFRKGICCTEPQQALEILRTSYKLHDVTRRSTKSIWTSVERPKRVTVSGISWAADTGTCKSLDTQIYSGTNRLSEMRKKIEAREQKLNDLSVKIIEGRGRSANERSKKKGDGPVTEGDGAPGAAAMCRGEEQKSFGQNLMSKCDLGKADEITVVREEVVVEPVPKKSKTKKKSNFFIKTFRSIKKRLYN